MKLRCYELYELLIVILGGRAEHNKDATISSRVDSLYQLNSHLKPSDSDFYSRYGLPQKRVLCQKTEWFWPPLKDAVYRKAQTLIGRRIEVNKELGKLTNYDIESNNFEFVTDDGKKFWVDLNDEEQECHFVKASAGYKVIEKEYLRNSSADVGKTLRVYWPQDDRWWLGRIAAWSKEEGHVLAYADGDNRSYNDLLERKYEIVMLLPESELATSEVCEVPKVFAQARVKHPKFTAASSVETKADDVMGSFHEDDDAEGADTEDSSVDEVSFFAVQPLTAGERTKLLSWNLLQNVDHFVRMGGCDIICESIEILNTISDDWSIYLVLALLFKMECILPYLKQRYKEEVSRVAYYNAINYLNGLNQQDSSHYPLNDIVILADVCCRMRLFCKLDLMELRKQDKMEIMSDERRQLVERFLLNLSIKYIRDSKPESRLFGLETVLHAVANVTNSTHTSPHCIKLSTLTDRQWLAQWIIDSRIIQQIYTGEHPELVRKSSPLVLLVTEDNLLTADHFRRLWDLSTKPDQGVVKALLCSVVSKLEDQQCMEFFHECVDLKCQCNDKHQLLRFVYRLTVCAFRNDKVKAKAFRKKLSSGEDLMAAVGKDKRCFYGLYLFWEYVQSAESLRTMEETTTAIELLVKLLGDKTCLSQQKNVINDCIRNIVLRKNVPESIDVLSGLLAAFPLHRSWWFSRETKPKSQESMIVSLQKTYNIVSILLEELTNYTYTPTECYPHLRQLQTRFDFLLFVLSRTPCRLTETQVEKIWNKFIVSADSQSCRDVALAWFGKAQASGQLSPGQSVNSTTNPVESLESLTRTALTEDAIRFVFFDCFAKMHCNWTSAVGFKVFLSYFININTKNKSLSLLVREDNEERRRRKRKRKAAAKVASTVFASFSSPYLSYNTITDKLQRSALKLSGEEHLWRLALFCVDEDVAAQAIDTIVHFQQNLSAKLKSRSAKLQPEFIRRCLGHLSDAIQDQHKNGDGDKELYKRRCALLLRSFLVSLLPERSDEDCLLSVTILPPAFDVPGSLSRRNIPPVSLNTPIKLTVRLDSTIQEITREAMCLLQIRLPADTMSLRMVSTGGWVTCHYNNSTQWEEVLAESATVGESGVTEGTVLKLCDLKCESKAKEEQWQMLESTLNTGHKSVKVKSKEQCRLESEVSEELHLNLLNILDNNVDLNEQSNEADSVLWECLSLLPTNKSLYQTIVKTEGAANVKWEDIYPEHKPHWLCMALELTKDILTERHAHLESPTSATPRNNKHRNSNESSKSNGENGHTRNEKQQYNTDKLFLNGGVEHLLSLLQVTQEQRQVYLYQVLYLISSAHPDHFVQLVADPQSLVHGVLRQMSKSAASPELIKYAGRFLTLCLSQFDSKLLLQYDKLQEWMPIVLLQNNKKQRVVIAEFLKQQDIVDALVLLLMNQTVHQYKERSEQYFIVLCHHVDDISQRQSLLSYCIGCLSKHNSSESFQSDEVDQYMYGLLQLIRALLHLPTTHNHHLTSPSTFAKTLFMDFLFSGAHKCKSELSRSIAFEIVLLLSRDEDAFDTIAVLINELLAQREQDQLFINDGLRDVGSGYAGLTNKGTTCYMNALLQQLHGVPMFRERLQSMQIVPGDTTSQKSSKLVSTLQELFIRLSCTARSCVDTSDLCSSLTEYDGTKIDLMEQKDAVEFGATLFDQLEHDAKVKQVLQSCFGGVLLNQIVSKDPAHEYVSETEEPFYFLPLDIKNKQSLTDALDSFVEGELMQGENAYQLPSGENVPAVKRCGIKEFPNHLAINLKRFEFDHNTIKTKKLNDAFTFPELVDLSKYNISNTESAPVMYELYGVLAHSGTSDSGHYYSFIKERGKGCSQDGFNVNGFECELKHWYEFNDNLVWPYCRDRIPYDCFGGTLPNNTSKNFSAFVLFYDKVNNTTQLQGSGMAQEGAAPLLRVVEQDNMQFFKQMFLYCESALEFVFNFAKSKFGPKQSALFFKYFIHVVAHAQVSPGFRSSWRDLLLAQFHSSPCSAVSSSVSSKDIINCLLDCPVASTRQSVADLLASAHSITVQYDTTKEKVGECKLMETMLECISHSFKCPKTCSEFYFLLLQLLQTPQNTTFICSQPEIISCLLDFITRGRPKCDLYCIVSCLATLVKTIENPGSPFSLLPSNTMVSDAIQYNLVTCTTWLDALISVNTELAKECLGHCIWTNSTDELSLGTRTLLNFLVDAINPTQKGDLQYLPFLRVLQHLLTLSDAAQEARCKHTLQRLLKHVNVCLKQYDGEDFAYFISRMLLSLAASSVVYYEEMCSHRDMWEGWSRASRKADSPKQIPPEPSWNVSHRNKDYLDDLVNNALASNVITPQPLATATLSNGT